MLTATLVLKEEMKFYSPNYYSLLKKTEQKNLLELLSFERVNLSRIKPIDRKDFIDTQEMDVLLVYVKYLLSRLNVLQRTCNVVFFKSGIMPYFLEICNKIIEKISKGDNLQRELAPLQSRLNKYMRLICDDFQKDISGKIVTTYLIDDYKILIQGKNRECNFGQIDSIHYNIELLTLILNFYYDMAMRQFYLIISK